MRDVYLLLAFCAVMALAGLVSAAKVIASFFVGDDRASAEQESAASPSATESARARRKA